MRERTVKLLATVSLVAVGFVGFELVSGYVSWLRSSGGKYGSLNLLENVAERLNSSSGQASNTTVTRTHLPSTGISPHPAWGWWRLPNSRVVTTYRSSNGKEYSFETSTDDEGRRLTTHVCEPEDYSLWVFGDSYLEGSGLNDESVFTSLLASAVPGLCVQNYAAGGYGNTHALQQINLLKTQGVDPPDSILVGYGDYYLERNVAAPSRIKTYTLDDKDYSGSGFSPADFTHPRARLEGETLVLDKVPLFWDERRSDLYNLSVEEQQLVSMKVLESIHASAADWGVQQMFLAYISGGIGDPVVEAARRSGFVIIDLRGNLGSQIDYDYVPLDSHPGYLAHSFYARKIMNQLELMKLPLVPGIN